MHRTDPTGPLRPPGQGRCREHDEGTAQNDFAPAQEWLRNIDQHRLGDEPGAKTHIGKVRPAVGAMLGLDLGGVPGAQLLRVFPEIGRVAQPGRRCDPVRLVPSGWVRLEGRGEPWQFVLQPVPGLPSEELASASDVEGVVVIGHGDHERLDERLLASVDQVRDDRLQLILRPDPGSSHDLWQTQRRPVVLSVEEPAELVLERLVTDGIGLADQDLGSGRQCSAAVHRTAEGIEHVRPVEHGLANERAAGIEVALEVAFVDARDLLRHRGHRRVLVIDAGQPQDDIGDLPVLRSGSPLRPRPFDLG